MFKKQEFIYRAGQFSNYAIRICDELAETMGVDIIKHGNNIVVLRTYGRSELLSNVRIGIVLGKLRHEEEEFNNIVALREAARETY